MVEFSQVKNMQALEEEIATAITKLQLILLDTEKDLYTYFQCHKEMAPEIVCPHCQKQFTLAEIGVPSQKTIDDWEKEMRSEPNAMTFRELQKYTESELKMAMVRIILHTDLKPRDLDAELQAMKRLVKTVEYIVGIYRDLKPAIETSKDQKELTQTMADALRDIQSALVMGLQQEV